MNTNITARTLTDHPYMQARVFSYPDGGRVLVSYSTAVVEVSPEGWLKVNGLYSMTTRKHIGLFMRELGMEYQTARAIFEANEEINIYTGEVRERA